MKQSKTHPKVTLVGAGPGSKDLITIRGIRALQKANVVIYDALIDLDLLKEIPSHIPKIYVGKRCGNHGATQETINELLVTNAFIYGHVVRLKGGDPFVFGRASEEIEHLESFGIPVSVVPGVTSAIAVPESQGIPLTKRGVSSSFWIVTATKKTGDLSEDLKYASQSSATIVILMGVRKIKEIAIEVKGYRGGLTPIALIQNGTMPNETCCIATLNTIETILASADVSMPGIIVIGNVVAEHPAFFDETIRRVLHSKI
ncbi:MAG: uroporphyrinogen-III C-methyltransferase [Flavobacteriaceae bacterium]